MIAIGAVPGLIYFLFCYFVSFKLCPNDFFALFTSYISIYVYIYIYKNKNNDVVSSNLARKSAR